MTNMKSALLSLSLVILSTFTAAGHASLSNGGVHFAATSQVIEQIQSELAQQQNWMISTIWEDFGVEVTAKDYSAETMKQLRALHKALKKGEAIQAEQFNNIIIACRRGHAVC